MWLIFIIPIKWLIITLVNLVQVGIRGSIFCLSILRKKEGKLEPVTFLSVKKNSTVSVVEPNFADFAFLKSKLFQAEEPQ